MRSGMLLQIVASVSVLATYAIRRWANPGKMARRSMSKVPPTPIAQLAEEGERSRVCGVVEAAGLTIISPVDREACIGFRLLIERHGKAGRGGEYWLPVVSFCQACQPFRDPRRGHRRERPSKDPSGSGWTSMTEGGPGCPPRSMQSSTKRRSR